ncbi:MAG: two-component sensor histidine kinase, partial [Oscillospiraceae bacterium]|nr:two-component sensor histidine kinase [Oscillospiraceae bacterium]
MTSKIFKSIISVATAVLMASLIIITGVLYHYFGNVQEEQLKDELSLAASATEQLGESYLESLESNRYRLTLVAADGTVIYDSHADALTMENHADREEVKEALAYGKGSSSRQSATLTEQTIYEAVRLENGNVLRISVSRATAIALVLGMVQPIAFVIAIAFCLSGWLADRMAKRVVEPLNKLNLDKPMENDVYEELFPLLRRIHAQHME